MIPIPVRMLPHVATVEEPDTSSSYGDTYLAAKTIGHVRFEPSVAKVDWQWAQDSTINAALYIDAVNSDGAFCPALRSRVTVDEHVGHVVSVKPVIAVGTTPHHWEVALS